MKSFLYSLPCFIFLTSCGDKPVEKEPSTEQLIGTWVCKKLPDGFTRREGISANKELPKLIISEDGSFVATNFPGHVQDFTNTWSLSRPGITPSGTWSIYALGSHFQCLKSGDDIKLRYNLDATYGYVADFERIHKPKK